ncbi:MAG TPA: hypothetical protein VEQ65_04210 [Opitutus sp.]|nr:hypothetical protein [Opitutus sp.]
MNRTSTLLRWLGLFGLGVIAFFAGRWSVALPTGSVDSKSVEAADATRVGNRAVAAEGSAAEVTERSKEPADIAAAVKQPPKSFAAEEERQRLIEQWAEKDPRAAIEFVRTQLRGDRQAQAMAAVLSIWAKNHPDAAWSWVSAEMPTATHHFDTMLEVFGRHSTETAARYAAQFAAEHPAAALEVHLAALLGVTHRGDFAGARTLVEGNRNLDPEVRANLHNFIAGQWARFAPEEALTWVKTLPAGPEREQALVGLGESWSDVDPAKATAFAVDLPSGPTRSLAMRQAIGKWVMTDPEAARAWVIQTERHEDFDQAVGTIATDVNLVNREPGRALKWASTIFDDTLRAQSVGAILFNWYPRDPAGAAAYVESSSDFTPEQRTEMLARLRSMDGAGG